MIALPPARLANGPPVVIANAALVRRAEPDDSLTAACGVELEYAAVESFGRSTGRGVDQLEALVRGDVPGALLRADRSAGNNTGPCARNVNWYGSASALPSIARNVLATVTV